LRKQVHCSCSRKKRGGTGNVDRWGEVRNLVLGERSQREKGKKGGKAEGTRKKGRPFINRITPKGSCPTDCATFGVLKTQNLGQWGSDCEGVEKGGKRNMKYPFVGTAGKKLLRNKALLAASP